MTTKILSLCLAIVGLGFLAIPNAGAHERVAASSTRNAAATLPSIVRVNQVSVEVSTGRRRYGREREVYVRRPHYRTVRRVYYRHGRRVVVVRRVRY